MKIAKVAGLGPLIGRHLLLAGMGLLPEHNTLGVIPADVRNRLFLDPAVSYHDILNVRKQGRTKRVLYGNIGTFVRSAHSWPIFQTKIQEIDQVFTVILKGSLIDRIARDAAIWGDKPFYVLDWGAGDLSAAKGLLVEMRKRGINNVRVIATTETIYPRMINDLEAEPAILMVVAPFQRIGRVMEKVLPEGARIQAGYSKNGFHFIFHEQWRREEVTLHFEGLKRFFSPDGFFVFNVEYPWLVKNFYSLLSEKDGIDRSGIWESLKVKVMEESRQSFRSGALPEVIHVVAGKGFDDAAAISEDPSQKRGITEEKPARDIVPDVTPASSGGIDLGAGTMDMFVDPSGGQVHFDTWSTEQLKSYQNALGFSPVIFDVKPLKPTSSILEVEQVLFPRG